MAPAALVAKPQTSSRRFRVRTRLFRTRAASSLSGVVRITGEAMRCQEAEMVHDLNCPHCGCSLPATQDTVRVPEVEAVELLRREIEHLRATVARLRGAGFNRLAAGP